MTSEQIKNTKKLLATTKKIAIIGHRNPDGDSMGSCLGLYHYLKLNNDNCKVIMPNEYPDFLSWIPSSDQALIFEKSKKQSLQYLQTCDLVFTLDFNAFHRTGKEMEPVLGSLNCNFIMIDHHETPDNYAKVTFSKPEKSSTCEMVYDFIEYLGGLNQINSDIATCLYTGLITDTGSFKFASTTASTLRIAANLKETGIETSTIYNNIFDNNSSNRLQILGKALQNIKILSEHNASYTSLSQQELDSLNYKKGDTEGVVNYGLSLKGVNMTAFFTENTEEGIIKISFRSIGDIDVNQFARNHFNGGGHKNAAGGKSELPLEETLQRFEQILKNNYAS